MSRKRFTVLASLSIVLATTFAATAQAQCGAAPQVGCAQVVPPLRSKIRIKNATLTLATRNDIKWLWRYGPQTPLAQLGSPETGADSYSLCIYDTGVLATEVSIPGGADWVRKPGPNEQDLLAYKGALSPYPPHGVRALKIYNKAGNAAKIGLKASRELVPVPTLPFTTPEAVTVQLVNTAGGCWEGNFNAGEHEIGRNDAEVFKAKGD
jgi:hypothetical protein